jgi:hypothetical protein
MIISVFAFSFLISDVGAAETVKVVANYDKPPAGIPVTDGKFTIEGKNYVQAADGKYYIEGAKMNTLPATAEIPTESGSTYASQFLKLQTGGAADAIVSGAQYALVTFFAIKMIGSMLGFSKTTTDALAAGGSIGIGSYKLLTTLKSGTLHETIGSLTKWMGKYSPLNSPGLWGVKLIGTVTYFP